MSEQYWYADEVKEIAEQQIANYLPELAQARFKFVYKEKCSKSCGRIVYGSTKKANSITSFLCGDKGCDYIIEVGADGWKDLTKHQREAMIYHLLNLCHVEINEETEELTYTTKKPEINEFAEVISRFGFWNTDLEKFGMNVKTLTFDNQPAAPKVKKEEKHTVDKIA
jgi:hypothetical protein